MEKQKMVSPHSWDLWRAKRLSSVVAPQGNLALIETRWLDDGEVLTDEEALAGQSPTVTVTKLERTDFAGNVIAQGVRLWDSKSEGIQSFETISVYPYNPEWIFEATFKPHGEPRPVPFEYAREKAETRELAVPGEIEVTIAGVNYTLDAFDDDGPLLLVFGDPTNRTETYPAGRFLFVHRTDDPERVIIDFNEAYVPPCGFSIHYNCPLPPPQNRIQVPVLAGEKKPIFKNDFEIH